MPMIRMLVLALALGSASALAQQDDCGLDVSCYAQKAQMRQAQIKLAQQQIDIQQAHERREQELHDQQLAQLQASTQTQAAAAKPLPPNWNTVAVYRTETRDLDAMTLYLSAAGDAFTQANAALEHDKRQPLYCAPSTVTLNADNYRAMIDKKLADTFDHSSTDQMTVGLLLLNAMRQTFPCPPQADQKPKRRERH
jgi:hypothetical protein